MSFSRTSTSPERRVPRPLREADLSGVEAVFTDVDGTLTTSGRLRSRTMAAVESLHRAGVRVVLVTGRPAGWAEAWIRTLPVEGVIAENGGLYFARPPGAVHVAKHYAAPLTARVAQRARLKRIVAAALRSFPQAKLSMDSAYTEVDLAIDYAEEGDLSVEDARRIEAFVRARGAQAVRSSVHVNCWVGTFDKLWMVRRFLQRQWRRTLRPSDRRYLYVGDSFNDAPLFRGFSLSVGVANVLPLLDELDSPPAFVTRRREGSGFEEVATAVLAARRKAR